MFSNWDGIGLAFIFLYLPVKFIMIIIHYFLFRNKINQGKSFDVSSDNQSLHLSSGPWLMSTILSLIGPVVFGIILFGFTVSYEVRTLTDSYSWSISILGIIIFLVLEYLYLKKRIIENVRIEYIKSLAITVGLLVVAPFLLIMILNIIL